MLSQFLDRLLSLVLQHKSPQSHYGDSELATTFSYLFTTQTQLTYFSLPPLYSLSQYVLLHKDFNFLNVGCVSLAKNANKRAGGEGNHNRKLAYTRLLVILVFYFLLTLN